MRSELPWLEPRSPWQRFGPTLLGLTIIGVGMGGAIRIVKAQDNAAPPPVTAITVAAAPQTSTDAPRISQEDRALNKELEDLLQQRADLDVRISELRQRLRSADRVRTRVRVETRNVAPRVETRVVVPRIETRAVPRVQIDPNSSDWRSAVEDARQQAREAMQQAREAMRQAQEALREAQRASSRTDGAKGAPGGNTPYRFFFDSKTNGAYKLDPDTMKLLQDMKANGAYKLDSEALKRSLETQQQWTQHWKEMQPQFEQQMRDFQQRMQDWQRSFESQQRQFEKQMRDQQYRSSDAPRFKTPRTPKAPDEPKGPETSREKSSDGDTDNEPL